MKDTTVSSIKELAATIGCGETVQDISRAVYKGTSCGAWAALAPSQPVSAERHVKVWIAPTKKGAKITRVDVLQDTVFSPKAGKFTLDDSVVEFMQAKRRGRQAHIGRKTLHLVQDAAAGGVHDNFTAFRFGHQYVVCFKAEVLTGECLNAGISVGSIVEGVDIGTETHTLRFPFTTGAFWDAVKQVEDEANDIWNNTHGCPKCRVGNGEEGLPAVNPKCRSCKGQGIII